MTYLAQKIFLLAGGFDFSKRATGLTNSASLAAVAG